MVAKLKESHYRARHEDDLRRSIVPGVAEEQGLLAADLRTLSYVCSHCHRYPLEDYIWWVSTENRNKTVQLVVRGMPEELEGSQQSLGFTGHCGSEWGQCVSGLRPTIR